MEWIKSILPTADVATAGSTHTSSIAINIVWHFEHMGMEFSFEQSKIDI